MRSTQPLAADLRRTKVPTAETAEVPPQKPLLCTLDAAPSSFTLELDSHPPAGWNDQEQTNESAEEPLSRRYKCTLNVNRVRSVDSRAEQGSDRCASLRKGGIDSGQRKGTLQHREDCAGQTRNLNVAGT
jgi:hypothetical protein